MQSRGGLVSKFIHRSLNIMKTISTSLLALFLSVLLVSCGGSDDKKDAANSIGDKEGPASAPRATAPEGPVGGASYNLSIVCNEAKEVVSITGSGLDPSTQTHTCAGSEAEDFPLKIKQGVSHPSPNELTISSEDEYGNSAGSETAVDVPIDTLAPRVSIINRGDIIEGSNASFEISVEDDHIASLSYDVSVDQGSAAPSTCTKNPCIVSVSGAAQGSLTLTVEAVTDDAGNSNAVVSDSLTVVASRLSISSAPAGTSVNATSYPVSGTCLSSEGTVTVTVGTPNVVKEASCDGTPGSYETTLDISSVSANPMSVKAEQGGLTENFLPGPVNDRVGPSSAPLATDPTVLVGGATYDLSIVCSEAGEIVSITGSGLDPATQTYTCTNSGTENFQLGIEQEVSHPSPNNLTISSTDQYGNPHIGAATEVNVPIDTLAPSISITSDSDNIVEGSSVNFEITVTDDHITNLSYTVSVDQGSATVTPSICTSNPCRVNVSGALQGSLTLTVEAEAVTDNAGNSNAVVSDSLTVVASRLSVLSAPAGTSVNASSYTVSGNCNTSEGVVTVTVGTPNVVKEASCDGTPGTYEVTLDISGVSANPMSVAVVQGELTANISPDPVNDQVGPSSAPLATAPTVLVDGATYDLAIVCSEAGEIVSITGSGLNPATQEHTCAGSGAEDFPLSLEQGVNHSSPNNLTISSTDQYENPHIGAATEVNVPINTLPSTVSITDAPSVTSSNAHNFRVEGACSKEGVPVMVSAGTTVGPVRANCASGSWFVELDVTALNGASISITADHSSATQASKTVTNSFICPANFIAVSALTDYTANSFCVMKYEAKNAGADTTEDDMDDIPTSRAEGSPWVNIGYPDSKCQGMGTGYDLITNDEWQSIARNIELVESNWSTGTVGNGDLNQGHSDRIPLEALAASGDDNKACEGTGQTCNSTTWNSQRRTHTLSNGEVIWDIAGNVQEWMKNFNRFFSPNSAYMSQITNVTHPDSGSLSGDTRTIKGHFGPSGDYTRLSSSPWGGLGTGDVDSSGDDGGRILRGGSYSEDLENNGVFATFLDIQDDKIANDIGFRCVFHL